MIQRQAHFFETDRPEDMLRERRIKLTPQRLAVYQAIRRAGSHLSADEVFRKVRPALPGISLATVYAILENFESHGLVREIRIDGERSFYEANQDGHHHFLCRRCRKIYDVPVEIPLVLKDNTVCGHKIEDFQANFFGVCARCCTVENREKT